MDNQKVTFIADTPYQLDRIADSLEKIASYLDDKKVTEEKERAIKEKYAKSLPIEYLHMTCRLLNICKCRKVKTLGDLAKLGATELLKNRNIGKETVREATDILTAFELKWEE